MHRLWSVSVVAHQDWTRPQLNNSTSARHQRPARAHCREHSEAAAVFLLLSFILFFFSSPTLSLSLSLRQLVAVKECLCSEKNTWLTASTASTTTDHRHLQQQQKQKPTVFHSTMNDLFRNMLASGSSSNSASESGNPFIGSIIELKENTLRLEELIAEGKKSTSFLRTLFSLIWYSNITFFYLLGGFGLVFRARDVKTSQIYALKRLINSDSESREEIENEISMLSRVQKHKHIMEFYYCDKVKPNISFLLW